MKHRIDSLKAMLNAFGKKTEFYYSIMEENTNLINEISNLRKEANIYLKKYNDLKSILKMKEYKKELERIKALKRK